MRIGYARVSTQEQDTQAQIAALKESGCERIFQEKASGGRWNRPELHRLLEHLRKLTPPGCFAYIRPPSLESWQATNNNGEIMVAISSAF